MSDTNDSPDVSVMRIAGHDYQGTTTVYTTGSGAEVFHADKQWELSSRSVTEVPGP